jgi:CxxC motif-containing protein
MSEIHTCVLCPNSCELVITVDHEAAQPRLHSVEGFRCRVVVSGPVRKLKIHGE